MIAIFAGSRTSTLAESLQVWACCPHKDRITEIVSGKAPSGGDLHGEYIAGKRNIPVTPFPAAWNDLSAPGAIIRINRRGDPYNVNAGFDRNEKMAAYAAERCPEGGLLIYVWDGKSRGTADMIRRALAHGLKLFPELTDAQKQALSL